MSDEEFIAEIKGMFNVLDERTKAMKDGLDVLKHVLLEGNGSPALTVQVATIDTRLKTVEEDQKEEKEHKAVPRQVSISIAVSILIGLVGLLAAFVGK